MREELSSVEILLVEGISGLKEYSISMSLLLSHKMRGRKKNIAAVNISYNKNSQITRHIVTLQYNITIHNTTLGNKNYIVIVLKHNKTRTIVITYN